MTRTAPLALRFAALVVVGALPSAFITNAALVITTPIASEIARDARRSRGGLMPLAFATIPGGIASPAIGHTLAGAPLVVTLGALCLLTLLSTSLDTVATAIIMDPGGYRFTDYARMGAPLVVLVVVTTALVLAWQYG